MDKDTRPTFDIEKDGPHAEFFGRVHNYLVSSCWNTRMSTTARRFHRVAKNLTIYENPADDIGRFNPLSFQ